MTRPWESPTACRPGSVSPYCTGPTPTVRRRGDMSGPATQPPVLATVRVRMYQVGFGDCFLLSFEYAGQAEPARHILIDFGTRQLAVGLNLADVAGEIDARTGGGPDVVVLSHRHQDHMSGFGGSGTDAVVGRWKPRLVVRSWTEDPAAPADATGPAGPGGPACARVSTRAARSRTRCPRRSPPRGACAPTSASWPWPSWPT